MPTSLLRFRLSIFLMTIPPLSFLLLLVSSDYEFFNSCDCNLGDAGSCTVSDFSESVYAEHKRSFAYLVPMLLTEEF